MSIEKPFGQAETGSLLCLHAPIKILAEEMLVGANVYHARTVVCVRAEFGPLSALHSDAMGSGFTYAFLRRFMSLPSFVPLNGLDKKFVERLRRGDAVAFPQLLLEAILCVETHLARVMHDLDTVDFAVVSDSEVNPVLIWESRLPKLSFKAAAVAVQGLLELLPRDFYPEQGRSGDTFERSLADLQELVKRRRLAASTSTLKLAAKKRGIPHTLLGRQHLILGEGAKQARMFASMSETTSSAAQKTCADKRQTNRILRDLRLPRTQQARVGSEAEAILAAEKFGFPLVVKPQKGNRGRRVSVGVSGPFELIEAFQLAHSKGNDVIVEKFVEGVDHRLLVVGNRFVAALIKRPPGITGDGVRTVAELIGALNSDPLRDGFRRYQIPMDLEMRERLLASGLTFKSVLEKGDTILLRETANISTGGLPIDITDSVHPDNRQMAERAARGLGLDVAGVDFITTDISRSYRDNGGAIIEVNARPGLCIHTWPAEGKPRNVAAAVLELGFPGQETGRLPVVCVAGDKGTGTVARYLDSALRAAGQAVALALTHESSVNGRPAELKKRQQEQAPLALLRDPEVETLIATVSLRKTARRGMLLERSDVSVIMHRQLNGDARQFVCGLEVLCRATSGRFVVDAGNALAMEQLAQLDAARLVLISDKPNDPVLEAHRIAGHAAVTLQWQGESKAILLWSDGEVVATFEAITGSTRDSNARKRRLKHGKMFAIGAAFALGMPAEQLATLDRHFYVAE